MAASTVLVFVAINLIQSFAATPPNCKMLQPKVIDLKSTTFSGKWHSLLWTTHYKPSDKRFGQVDNAFLEISPIVEKNKIAIKGYLRIGDKCESEKYTFDLSRNGVDLTTDAQPFMLLRILDTEIQDSLILHVENIREDKIYHTLSFYGRKPVATEIQKKTFEEQVQCLGMKTNSIVALPQLKEVCKPEDTIEVLKTILKH